MKISAILYLNVIFLAVTQGTVIEPQCSNVKWLVCCKAPNGLRYVRRNPSLCFDSRGIPGYINDCPPCQVLHCPPGFTCKRKKKGKRPLKCVPRVACPCTREFQLTCCLTREGNKVDVDNPCLCTYCGSGGANAGSGTCEPPKPSCSAKDILNEMFYTDG